MEISDYIASHSMSMANTKVQQSASIAVMKMAMDMQSQQSEMMAELLEVPPSTNMVDILA